MSLVNGATDLARNRNESPCNIVHDVRGERKRLRSSQELDKKLIIDRLNGIGKNGFNSLLHGQFEVDVNAKDFKYNCNGPNKRDFTPYATFTDKMRLRSNSLYKSRCTTTQLPPDTIRKVNTRSKVSVSCPCMPQTEFNAKENGEFSTPSTFLHRHGKNGFFSPPNNDLTIQKTPKSPGNVTSDSFCTSTEDVSRQSCCANEATRPASLRLYNNHTKNYKCRWMECLEAFQVSSDLARHVKEKHVQPMIESDVFYCLWNGCKVYNRPSCSHKWLTKHMYAHVGNKPFKCVIDGCELSFATQNGLARHVPSHFGDAKNKRMSSMSPSVDQEGISPNRKRQRTKWYMNRRNVPHLGNQNDGFDQLTMDYIKEKLLTFETSISKKSWTRNKDSQHLPKILGKRTLPSGRQELLIDFKTSRSKEEKWVDLSDFKRHQSLKSNAFCFPNSVEDELYLKYFSTLKRLKRGRRK